MKKAYILIVEASVYASNLETAQKKLARRLRDTKDVTWGVPQYNGAAKATKSEAKFRIGRQLKNG